MDDLVDDEKDEGELRIEGEKFQAADSNGDKVLDANEFLGLLKAQDVKEVDETLKQKDLNQDGMLTPPEFFNLTEKTIDDTKREVFKKLDHDGNGKLDWWE